MNYCCLILMIKRILKKELFIYAISQIKFNFSLTTSHIYAEITLNLIPNIYFLNKNIINNNVFFKTYKKNVRIS